MKVLKFLACAGLTVAAWPASAADLLGTAPPLTMPASQGPAMFEVGSNWYLRGELGISFDQAPTISLFGVSTPPPGLVGSAYATSPQTSWSTDNFTGGSAPAIASTTTCGSTPPGTMASGRRRRARRRWSVPMGSRE